MQTNIRATIDAESAIQSDGWNAYHSLSPDYNLETVKHSKQFVRRLRKKVTASNVLTEL